MQAMVVILLSMLAGWLVNVLADALPERRSLRGSWTGPFLQLAYPQRHDGGNRRHFWRTLLAWLLALGLGWLAYRQGGWRLSSLIVALYGWFFLIVAVIDLEHRRVLNRMLVAALPLAALSSLVVQVPPPLSALLGAAAGFGLFLVIAVARPGGMGMGDVKLAGLVGLVTGLAGVFVALTVGILAGGLVALLLLVWKRFDRSITMAYAPYLVVGVWVALYVHPAMHSQLL